MPIAEQKKNGVIALFPDTVDEILIDTDNDDVSLSVSVPQKRMAEIASALVDKAPARADAMYLVDACGLPKFVASDYLDRYNTEHTRFRTNDLIFSRHFRKRDLIDAVRILILNGENVLHRSTYDKAFVMVKKSIQARLNAHK